MNGNVCSRNFLFKVIVSKYQLYIQSKITLLLKILTTGIADIMASLGNSIINFNKEIQYVYVGTIRETYFRNHLQPMLIVVRIMDPLHATSKCCRISTTMAH